MSAGAMDRPITLERNQGVENDFGEVEADWRVLAQVWAERVPLSDGERWRAGEVAAQITHRFKIYWSEGVADLTPRDRLIGDDGLLYDIAGVKEIGRREFIEITASARTDK